MNSDYTDAYAKGVQNGHDMSDDELAARRRDAREAIDEARCAFHWRQGYEAGLAEAQRERRLQ